MGGGREGEQKRFCLWRGWLREHLPSLLSTSSPSASNGQGWGWKRRASREGRVWWSQGRSEVPTPQTAAQGLGPAVPGPDFKVGRPSNNQSKGRAGTRELSAQQLPHTAAGHVWLSSRVSVHPTLRGSLPHALATLYCKRTLMSFSLISNSSFLPLPARMRNGSQDSWFWGVNIGDGRNYWDR